MWSWGDTLNAVMIGLTVADFIPGVDVASGSVEAGIIGTRLAIGAVRAARAADEADETVTAIRGVAAVRKGQEGEAAVRAVHDIGPREHFSIHERDRISDGSNNDYVSEIKNTARQGLTKQIQDTIDHAKGTGKQARLYTRSGTKISKKLQAAIDNGHIEHHHIPGT